MKRSHLGVVVLIGLALSVRAQPPAAGVAEIWITLPVAGPTLVQFDPSAFSVDLSGTTPILRLKPTSAGQTINERHQVIHPPAGQQGFTPQDSTIQMQTLKVYVNGLLVSLGDDYMIAGNVVTLSRATVAGDVVALVYNF